MQDFERILNRLEDEIKNAKKAVLSNNKIIDDSKCLDYIAALKDAFPNEIMEANCVVSDRDAILNEAKEQADEIVDKAIAQAKALVEESAIVKKADAVAQMTMNKAEAYVSKIYNETKKYVDEILSNAENNLTNVLALIRESREDLHGSLIPNIEKK